MFDYLHYRLYEWKTNFGTWKFWTLDGWPFKRRCPECAGVGTTNTEIGARYVDEPNTCSTCGGSGFVKR